MKSPNKPLFIPAGVNITERHVDCNYFATMNPEEIERRWNSDEGTELFNKISNAGFSREAIETCMGKFYGKIDLRGFNFSNQKIPYHNFADCDLFRANFENADCGYSDFSDSWLSEANLKSANFQWCKMDNVLLDNIKYNVKTNFTGIDLSKVNFTLATLFRDVVLSQQRIVDLKRQQPCLATILRVTTDYGRSMSRWAIWCCIIIMLFGWVYFQFELTTAGNDIWSNFYFSLVTFTTVGYGDIIAVNHIGKAVAMFEIVLGYLMGGLLVAILVKKVVV